MDSYVETQFLHHHNHNHNHQQQNNNNNSGLLRFRSAPSSLFNEFTHNSNDSSEKLMMGRFGDQQQHEYSDSFERKPQPQPQGMNCSNGYSNSGQLPPQYPKHNNLVVSTSSSIERSNSVELTQSTRQGNGGGGGLNLSRQSSSPAGFFNHLTPQNGFATMRGIGNFKVGNSINGESSPRTSSRLSMTHLPLIPEIANENVKETSPDGSPAGFSFASWGDAGSEVSHLSENGGLLGRPNVLSHHLSLPKTSAEMAAIEKMLHFQDTVPCKIRAKRGFATHPRSIAERVRRNRISERMRKLQELVPNMDKQTNTADMLDLAVDYIKALQNQHKILSDNRAKCKCAT